MTTYNREKYIIEAIESVLASTYINFELIIVDDGSKDDTVNIAKSYALKDPRVFVYINEKNLGDYPNRNKAASYAKGKYLKYVDADDFIYPWGLEILVSSMEKHPEAGWGLCSLNQDIDRPYPFLLKYSEIYAYHFFKSSLFHKAPLSAIIKRDVFNKVGRFSGKQHMGDYEMWHLLGLEFDLVLMTDGLVWSREHSDQQMSDNRNNPLVPFKYALGQYSFFECHRQEIPLQNRDYQMVKIDLKRRIFKTVIKMFIFLRFRLGTEMVRMYKKRSQYKFSYSSNLL
jgi:glycosyltransferase involved in cell wall biosynthesis